MKKKFVAFIFHEALVRGRGRERLKGLSGSAAQLNDAIKIDWSSVESVDGSSGNFFARGIKARKEKKSFYSFAGTMKATLVELLSNFSISSRHFSLYSLLSATELSRDDDSVFGLTQRLLHCSELEELIK